MICPIALLMERHKFPLKFDNRVRTVTKLASDEFSPLHDEMLSQVRYVNRSLVFPDRDWDAIYLGEGEEKAVFCICDHQCRVFAIELIDERYYMNGRFVGGQYFAERRLKTFSNIKRTESAFGLHYLFTGLVKVREFVYGYEWSRFRFDPQHPTLLDSLITGILRSAYNAQFANYQKYFKDVHDRNVMFEIRPFQQHGVPMIIKDWHGKIRFARIGLQAIDVR